MWDWRQLFFYRRECLKTTWTFRLIFTGGVLLLLWATAAVVAARAGKSLVCDEDVAPSDVILVDNLEPSYFAFERAAELRRRGMAPRVLVPTPAGRSSAQPELVAAGVVDVMARVAEVGPTELIPVGIAEPISLNAAYQIRNVLEKQRVKRVIVVAAAFRSRRSVLIYGRAFADVGIATFCVPAFGPHTPENWTDTWHGIQEVIEQVSKLQYYRWWVLPRLRAELR